jgi:hypothetical protein
MDRKQQTDWYRLHEGDPVIFAAFADPPGPVKAGWGGIISLPDSWNSNAVDRMIEMEVFEYHGMPADGRVFAAAWDDEGGPVVLIRAAVREVLKYSRWVALSDMIVPRTTSFCATVEHCEWGNHIIRCGVPCAVAKDAWVERMEPMDKLGGCNAASEAWFPGAVPYSRSLRRYRHAMMQKEYGNHQDDLSSYVWYRAWVERPRLSDSRLRRLFPDVDFSDNAILNEVADLIGA